VAGPAALLVAKLHKLGERQESPHRLLDKDAHDVYRLLVAVETEALAASLGLVLEDEFAGEVTDGAIEYFIELFASGDDAPGAVMAGRAEELIGDPAIVRVATAALARDLIDALGR